MTVSSSTSRSGPYSGNGVVTAFNYGFRILDQSHLAVYLTSSAGVETLQTLTTHYTVAGVGDASGTITMVTAPATGETITIVRDVPQAQETALGNQGAFLLATVEGVLDKNVMMIQQLSEQLTRSVKVAVSSGDDPDALVASVVASAAAAAVSAAAAEAAYDSFDDRYLGSKASDPSVDNDGNALVAGALYFNSASGLLKVWDGAAWGSASANIADDAVTLAKWAHGTHGGIPYYGASGAPAELAVGTSGLPLVTKGAAANPAYEALAAVGLAANAVTTAKILDANVTTAKLATNAATNAKLAQVATARIKGRATAGTGDVEDLTVAQVLTLLQSTGLLATARAKVANNGTITVNESVGVTSVTRTGAGVMDVVLATTMSSSDYVISAMMVNTDGFINITAQSATGFTIRTDLANGAATDQDFYFTVHGTPA